MLLIWEVAKGKFIIIDKNRIKIILPYPEKDANKSIKKTTIAMFKNIYKDDIIKAIYKFKINKIGEKAYKILEVLKINNEDKNKVIISRSDNFEK